MRKKMYTIKPKKRINKNLSRIWIRQRFEKANIQKHQIGYDVRLLSI